MKQRTSRVLSSDEHLLLWRDLEQREFKPEEEVGMARREDIESRISGALSVFGKEGWDFQCDHFGPPVCVVRFTLMNVSLHRREVVEAALNAFDELGSSWVLDLGFVDAIQGGVLSRCVDVGRLIATSSELLLDERFDAKCLPSL